MALQDTRCDDILDISITAGRLILQNGGETYRCEETMISIASSLGAVEPSAFVTPTVVMLSFSDSEGKSYSRFRRITTRTLNLGIIARINELSRRLAKGDTASNLARIRSLLSRVEGAPLHHPAGVVIATALASFCFSLLFNGSLSEAFVAFCIGALMRMFLFLILPLGLTGFIVSAIGAAVVTLLSGLAFRFGLVGSTGNISIAVLMSLVPGLVIVNSIRDIIAGDLVAGSARLLDAFVIAAGLSLGAGAGLAVIPVTEVYVSAAITRSELVLSFILSCFAGASFAYFYYISKYDIIWTALLAGCGWTVYLVSGSMVAYQAFPYFAGALFVGLFSELFAVIFKKPATVYIVSGIIPLVPGGGMYEIMRYSMTGNLAQADLALFNTLSAAAAIAVGIAVASSIARLFSRAFVRATLRHP